MAWGLPKLPGLTFNDPTKTQFHIKSSLRFHQGYRFPDSALRAPGGVETDADSNAFAMPDDSVNYDPSLTYGRVKQSAYPALVPHFVHYDKRCLNFTAFFKQPVFDSPDEKFRVRIVNLVYFLEDDSLTVMEPRIRNSGLWQGRMVTRGKIPKNDLGDCWHWKDLNNGKDICIYGKVFHTVSCDLFTKEWLESQGVEIAKEEALPQDEFTQKEHWKSIPPPRRAPPKRDGLRRFLEYEGKVLAFKVYWDNRDAENGELTEYKLLYFLQDDTIAVKELHDGKGGKDPFPLLLKKTKLPKKWKEKPVSFPSTVLETTEEEVTEYYAPSDLIVGQTVFVLGRRFLVCDCDEFTRLYYRSMLNIEQPAPVIVKEKTQKEFPRTYPPHIGIGAPEDSLQSCFGLIPKPVHKDVIKYNLNASKKLRYLCELDWVHPEDDGRRFLFSYSLADGTIRINEMVRRNSGIMEGTFLKSMRLQLPDSDPSFPTYYTPDKFYIGAIIPVFKHRFRILGCDLFVYRYMSANPEKFPPEVIDNVRNYHMREGNLKDELQSACIEEEAAEKTAQLGKIGAAAVAQPSAMQKCLTALKVVEGHAAPPRPPTPPMTTDTISYDDTLRYLRASKPTCDNLVPLKGILKSGAARDDHQKVVCFTGPSTDQHEQREKKHISYPPGEQPHFTDDPDFCDRFKPDDLEERAARRAGDICAYDVIPYTAPPCNSDDDGGARAKLPGYLGTYGVDCKETADFMRLPPDAYEKAKAMRQETADFMRLPPDAYEKAKAMRQEVPFISPAAVRNMQYARLPDPPVESCINSPPKATGPCAPRKEEDVSFGCPRVEPIEPGCEGLREYKNKQKDCE